MNKTIYMMAQLLEKNNIPLPDGARKKEGGSNSENKERCHALVVGSSGSPSFVIYPGASSHMDSVQDSFSTLHPYNGPSILMGDDSEIPAKGIGKINIGNGYFNDVLYVPDIASKILSMYHMIHIGLAKRFTFT